MTGREKLKKILIIGDVNHPLLNQLVINLKEKNYIHIDILDMFGSYYRYDKYFDMLYTISGSKVINDTIITKKAKSYVSRYILLKELIKEMDNYDVINVHFMNPLVNLLIKFLKEKTPNLIITIWGSDFYRISNFRRTVYKKSFNLANRISFTNQATEKAFLNFYGDKFYLKTNVVQFGLQALEDIDNLLNNEQLAMKERNFLKKYGINQKKLIVTVGYNSSYGQQHETIIQELNMLPDKVKSNILFLFPMAYGSEKNKIKITNTLKRSGLNYKVLGDFLKGEELALLRIVSDIMLNLQISDQLSGSMQETLHAGNIVITGGWLPYDIFKNAGINFVEIYKLNELSGELLNIIENYDTFKKQTIDNNRIINSISSWSFTINQWYELYKIK